MTAVNTSAPMVEDSAAAAEALRLELELCRRELDEYRRRVGHLERGETLLAGENRLLQMVASGAPLVGTLTALCRLIEELSGGSLCGILLVDSTGTRVEYATGPTLPASYNEALHGLPVTPTVGPCGMAVCHKEQVLVTDLTADARWDQGWRTLAMSHGLRACWSTPILSSVGRVLGTFAIYWREPRSPAAQDQEAIAQITHLASVAIERKRSEEGLRRGDAYLAEAQRLSRTGSFGWNVTTGQIIWSAETFCIMGYDADVTPTLDLVLKRVHPDDVGLVQHTIDRATRDSAAFDFEHRLLMPNGTVKHVQVVAHPSKTDSGCVEFVGAVMDITERKRAEAHLRQSEAELHEAQRLTHTGSWKHDLASGTVKVSPEVYRIFAIQPGEDASSPQLYFGRIHPEDRPRVQELFARCETEKADYQTDYRIVLPDGTIRHQVAVGRPVVNAAGDLVEFVGTVMDVTEQKMAQDELRAAKARFEGILEIADDAIISVDSSQRIVLFNQGAEKVFGYDATEVIGQSLDILLPLRFAKSHPKHIEVFSKSPDVSRTMGQRREVFGRRKDGSEFPAEASISKLDLSGELFFTVILRDITERKKVAEALRASEQLARGQVQALKKTLDALATESDPDRLVGHILSTITEQFGAHSASVWRRDEASGGIVFDSAFEDGHFVPRTDARFAGLDLSLPMDEFRPWTEVFRTGKTSVIEDIRTGAPFPLRDRLLPLGVIAILLVPMFVTGRLEGAIGIRFTRKRMFRDEEIELAQALANQAMLAVQLASLYAQNRQTAVIAERNRLARDIHDTLAQGFTGVIMQLEAAKGAAAQGGVVETANRIDRANELARSSLAEARRSVRALRLPSLQAGKLSLAIENLLKRMTDGSGLQAEFHADGQERLLAADCEEALLRITQEALTNTIKHAQARNFRATLAIGESKAQLQLTDDGRGFDPRAEHDGFGLTGMRERVERMSGQFVVRSKPGEGTEIVVILNHPNAHEQT